jgi:hypothetical protein
MMINLQTLQRGQRIMRKPIGALGPMTGVIAATMTLRHECVVGVSFDVHPLQVEWFRQTQFSEEFDLASNVQSAAITI